MKILPRLLYKACQLRWWITRPITVGVRLLLIKEASVLLIQSTYQNGWYLVGGGVKRNEILEEAARREAQEEVGALLGTLELLGVYTNFYDFKNDHVIVFICTDFSLTGKTDNEIQKFEFFPLTDLPAGIAPGHKRRIQEYLESHQAPKYGKW
ncbi:MAG: NUDIX domain-containing protein [Anaerolineales bacterium]|nr:NUDIX domain-containing protein [Anaerolineales bacterium]